MTSIGFLSSAPPTPCGIATFTSALGEALVNRGNDVTVVRVLDAPEDVGSDSSVVGELITSDPSTIAGAVAALNGSDLVIIQHEYGLYGGSDGADVLEVLAALKVPSIAVLHTVLSHPSSHQVEVLNAVIRGSSVVVVMTSSAEATLRSVNDVGTTPLSVIAHGAALGRPSPYGHDGARPLLLTWGLLGPGKGVQWVIDALTSLRDLHPQPHYLVAGRTHPKVLAHQGDVYRESLEQRVVTNGVQNLVEFDNSYRDLTSLNLLIESATVVLLPYDSHDQATSGVLVDAIAAGRPVIATAFPHAVELLSTGAGIVVPHGDADALAGALRRTLTEPGLLEAMTGEARRLAPGLGWDGVAVQYQELIHRILQRVAIEA